MLEILLFLIGLFYVSHKILFAIYKHIFRI